MVEILQITFSNAFYWQKSVNSLIQISLKFFLSDQIDDNPVLAQRKVWHLAGDKPLVEWLTHWPLGDMNAILKM